MKTKPYWHKIDTVVAVLVVCFLSGCIIWQSFFWIAGGNDPKAVPALAPIISLMLSLPLFAFGLSFVFSKNMGRRTLWALYFIPPFIFCMFLMT